jgi:hypothetical protein
LCLQVFVTALECGLSASRAQPNRRLARLDFPAIIDTVPPRGGK